MAVTPGIFKLLMPASGWPAPFHGKHTYRDLEAGIIGAILALPQAIALATLAGMPPVYGIYASIIPVLIALIWGSSWFTLSGPNTAVSVMLAATILPFAALGSERFIELVFLLSLFIGLIQLVTGFFKLGTVLDFISSTVILGVIQAVAIILLISALFSMSLTNVASESGIFNKLLLLYQHIYELNSGTLLIGVFTIICGLLAKLIVPRYALLIAMLAGTLFALVLKDTENELLNTIPLLGTLPLSVDILRMPALDEQSLRIVVGQWDDAIAIAFLGLMQTVIISRSIAIKSGQIINTNQEIIGQGLANSIAPFVSAFAGSGSFNRSATNYQAGAKTPYAGIIGVVLLIVFVTLGQNVLGFIPKAVISATLFLVGIGLFDFRQVKEVFFARAERWIFMLTFTGSLLLGLNVGVLVGVFSSLLVYLWHTSQPNIESAEYLSRTGQSILSIGIDGNLFFGSIPVIESYLVEALAKTRTNQVLLFKTNHLSYLDIPGAGLIIRTIKRVSSEESEAYIYVSRPSVLETLKKAGLNAQDLKELVIYKGKPHPKESALFPYQQSNNTGTTNITSTQHVVKQLKKTALLSTLPDHEIASLLNKSPPESAEPGEIIIGQTEKCQDHLILLGGELEVQRIWSVPDANDRSHTWILAPDNTVPAVLPAIGSQLRVRAVSDAQYIFLNADTIDYLLGWENDKSNPEPDTSYGELVQRLAITYHFPREVLSNIAQELSPMDVEAGEVIIWQGEKGDCFYLIEDGEAEIIHTDNASDETTVINQIGPGQSFGEEALIQDTVRNATIRMLTPGRLQVLGQTAFRAHVQTEFLKEITADEAFPLLQTKQFKLVDCRSESEYEDSHIKGAMLMPLHELRDRIHELDADYSYLVYCRSGQRSKAAAYLLQERNLNAASIKGGIMEWPFEIEYGEV